MLGSGFDPSKLFHRKVNKRVIPEYYETIKEPVALSTVKQKINTRVYQSFADFVRDFALIPHNAQVFNRPDSGAFQDALVIKEQLEKNLQQLVEEGVIDKAMAALPDLGEIPIYEDAPAEEGEEDEEESDEEGEEEEEEEEEEGPPKKRKRGRPSLQKRETGDDEGPKRPRGRPPRLLTPMEARIQAVLKGMRKPKNNKGQHMVKHFDRLPDKQAMPEYYLEVKNPMAYDLLKRKVKRKKYTSLENFMADVNLMFDNAKNYNTDESQIYQDAVALQIEAGRLYDIEKAKSDSSFADDEGKIPMPEGILHNGEHYKVGDWAHVQNANDLTKPIPAQIYRTYRNPNGQVMVNVCWYYRPEQTVHRFDKHFFANEVVKTGRYKDHRVEEIEGRCFIMFTTRFFKGRPRNTPEGVETYVCEARYNEERAQFNKIKTWASCLPDEVRDRDYEMDLFDQPRRIKKFPSPIRYLLNDGQNETDELPKATWGAEGAPPKIGAVHRRPRSDKESPPPEPTPPPPPKMPTPPPRQMPQPPSTYHRPSMGQQPQQQPARPPSNPLRPSYGAAHPGTYSQPAVSPAPARPQSMQQNHLPLTPQQQPVRSAAPQTAAPSYHHVPPSAAAPAPPVYPPRPAPAPSASSYRDPPPIEVYTLPDQANLSIPSDIREQYQRDQHGRVLFFTAPPLIPADSGATAIGGHSVRYLAAKARRAEELAQKRKQRELDKQAAEQAAKRAKLEEAKRTDAEVEKLKHRALKALEDQLRSATDGQLSEGDLSRLAQAQEATRKLRLEVEERKRHRAEASKINLTGDTFADDWDPRIT